MKRWIVAGGLVGTGLACLLALWLQPVAPWGFLMGFVFGGVGVAAGAMVAVEKGYD